MKKCNECNVEMIEDTNLHTDHVGGASLDEQIFLTYNSGKPTKKIIDFIDDRDIERVKARVCPNCGKVELFIEIH